MIYSKKRALELLFPKRPALRKVCSNNGAFGGIGIIVAGIKNNTWPRKIVEPHSVSST